MEGSSQFETCLPSLFSPCAPSPPLAPLPNQHKLLQMPLFQVQEQGGNHGVMPSSDHQGGLYPLLLPGIPFCNSSAGAGEKPTGFVVLDAGEVN